MDCNTTNKSILKETLSKYNTIVFYEPENKEKIPLPYLKEHDNKVFLDLSQSSLFKNEVMSCYELKKLPCAIVNSKVVYFDKIEELNMKIKELTKSAKIFIFIKGTFLEPKCKFTRELLSILKVEGLEYGKDFLEFNILENEEMRAGLKEINNWPTIPQIYIKNEFIGGLDVIKKMIKDKEFKIRIK